MIIAPASESESLITVRAQAQTVSATPCPSPAKLSNVVDRCNPLKPPTAAEIAEREKLAKEAEASRKRRFAVKFPQISEFSADLDGDNKTDKILYQIKRWKNDFEGFVKITSARGKILWTHSFPMGGGDLSEFLSQFDETPEKETTLADWVQNVFDRDRLYAFEVEKTKLKAADLDVEQIRFAAKLHKIPFKKLRAEILSQSANRIFTYRAEWREDLMKIVYVPSLKKFVCYTRGY